MGVERGTARDLGRARGLGTAGAEVVTLKEVMDRGGTLPLPKGVDVGKIRGGWGVSLYEGCDVGDRGGRGGGEVGTVCDIEWGDRV